MLLTAVTCRGCDSPPPAEIPARLTICKPGAARPEQWGFYFENEMPYWITWLWSNGGDVLAPDGLNAVDRRLTVPPLHTVEVPGGSQALQRTELVEVELGDQRGTIPRPSLLGAILVKTRAIAVDDAKDSQRLDLAFLLTLVAKPEELAAAVIPSERQWLRARPEMNDPERAWWRAQGEQREWGLYVLRTLMG